jgi:hypothetical protein
MGETFELIIFPTEIDSPTPYSGMAKKCLTLVAVALVDLAQKNNSKGPL